MKEQVKIIKRIITVIILCLLTFTSLINVNATSDFIELGVGTQTRGYIAGFAFPYKVTKGGKYVYGTNAKRNNPQNIKAYLVKNSRYINGGVYQILKNGYPSKSITGDIGKDYYITQTALWWYYDMTMGTNNLDNNFKTSGEDTYGLRQTIKNLAYEGYNHRNDSITLPEPKLTIGVTSSNEMILQDGYYISNDIKATTAQNISSYTVVLSNVPSGTKIVASNGTESTYSKEFKVNANDTFRIKVPTSGLSESNTTIGIKAVAQGTGQMVIEEYQPTDTSMQSVLQMEQASKTVTSETTVTLTTSKVTISKIDSVTKKMIAGAKLVLKNSSGATVTSWTSTTSSHVIHNLAADTYTIEEIAAPSGYQLNTNKATFTISSSNRDVKISFENIPQKSVVNITKVDQDTLSPLSGAVLIVKSSAGVEVAKFTTTTNPYVLTDLPYGTYTVEEISAPTGYIMNTNKQTFTIDDSHLSHQITISNAKSVPIPDTASNTSILMAILGVIFTGISLSFVKKNAK